MSEIKIQDVGPITKLDLQLQPGVTVLRGRNETGKTTALRAVEAITHGKKSGLEPRDGSKVGYVHGGGVMLQIGKRTKRSGECEFTVVSDPADISKLVEPGYVDQSARTRARVRALLSLTGQDVTMEQFREAIAKEVEVDDTTSLDNVPQSDDPVDTAAAIRRHLQTLAREAEKRADEYRGQYTVLLELVADLPEGESFDEDEISEAIQQAVRQQTALENRKQEAQRAKARRDEIRPLAESLSDRLNELGEARCSLAESKRLYESVNSAQRVVDAEVLELEEKLRKAKAAAETNRTKVRSLADEVQAKAERIKSREEMVAVASSAEKELNSDTVAEPTPEEIEAAYQEYTTQTERQHLARKHREAIAKREQMDDVVARAESSELRAEKLRKASDAIDDVLSSAVNVAGLRVHRGELVIDRDGKIESFDRLSHGARWKAAIQTAAVSVRHLPGEECMPVVAIPQEAWEGLDPENREYIQAIAVECEVAVVTAQSSDGLLIASRLGEQPEN